MTNRSRKEGPGGDAFVERLGDRITGAPAPPPPRRPLPGASAPPGSAPPRRPPPRPLPGGAAHPTTKPVSTLDAVDAGGPVPGTDPFAAFEEADDLDGESTRIEEDNLIAEQATQILDTRPDPPFLEVAKGKDHSKRFVLAEGMTTVGRSIDNEAILSDISVSRHHLRVARDPAGGLTLHDLGSGNGSLLNGVKVSQAPLKHGDRIELGATVLVVRIPGSEGAAGPPPAAGAPPVAGPAPAFPAPAPMPPMSAPPQVGALPGQFAGPLSGPAASLPPSTTEGRHLPPWAVSLVRRARESYLDLAERVRPFVAKWVARFRALPPQRRLVVLASFGLVLLLFGSIVMAFALRDGESATQGPSASDQATFNEGVEAFEQGRFVDAERAFMYVLANRRGDPIAQDYLTRTRAARDLARQLQQAQALIETDPRAARLWAASVPDSSALHDDAQRVLSAAVDAELRQLDASARAAVEQGQIDAAEGFLSDARALSPEHSVVASLEALIEENRPRAGRRPRRNPRTPRTTSSVGTRRPVRGMGPVKRPTPRASSRYLAAYRQRNFDAAIRAARAQAEQASGAEARRLERTANKIQQFARAFPQVVAGHAPLQHMRTAARLDREISNGYFARQINPRLLAAYLTGARAALGRDDYARGCPLVTEAAGVDRRNAAVRRMATQCERQAAQLVQRATRMERSDPAGATRLYRQVGQMVPRNSPSYQEAYRRRNQLSARRNRDEDE